MSIFAISEILLLTICLNSISFSFISFSSFSRGTRIQVRHDRELPTLRGDPGVDRQRTGTSTPAVDQAAGIVAYLQQACFSVTPVTFLNRCNHPCYRVSPAHRSWPTQRPVTSCACTNAETGFRHPPGRPGSCHSILCFVYISMAFTVCPWSDTLLSSWKQRIPGRGKAKVYNA